MADEHHNSFDLYDSLEGARNGQSTDDEGSPSSMHRRNISPTEGGIVRKKPPPLNIVASESLIAYVPQGKYLLHELMDPFCRIRNIFDIATTHRFSLYISNNLHFPLFLQKQNPIHRFHCYSNIYQKVLTKTNEM
jgi:hypothetical protein